MMQTKKFVDHPNSMDTIMSLMMSLKMTTLCLLLDTAKLFTLLMDIMKVLWQ
uniref:Formin binding protein 1 like n=1 Tax=Rousettus aegyptiacus TaxID=9407 RepID=A0A7J8K8N0_ROUAE|nr:formin binding protein 1 like [Rousettus aegyptiacus]